MMKIPFRKKKLTVSEKFERAKSKMPLDVFEAHVHSSKHRSEILNSDYCGCFYCLNIYKPSEISEWVDDGTCAICPKCEIDAVIGDKSGFAITEEFLSKMNHYWFE